MNSITQDMKFRYSLMRYAERYGVARASRKYNKAKSYIYFWKARFDGSIESLACQSRRPHSHPRQHTEAELKLIRDMRRRGEEVPVDAFGHPRLDKVNVGQYVGKRLGELLKAEKVQVFKSGYFARSAAPNTKDLRLIEKCARKAVACALEGISGVVGPDENDQAKIQACAFERVKGGKPFNVRKGSFRKLVEDIGQPKLRKKRTHG